ncbi:MULTISPECIES: AzlD domain-containing protein [unclassified Streptococcus]|uniref:AzlD domain-containing protein n=1 Tax=unclassified Streptococcus TaxID=2608887 RepID=UPI001072B89B|nr:MULTISPECIES: AzlD domain-containing protein [unclassified Streptococcus]MBF0788062.1 AzlD domain-containing protein [Streptococcus sp. 19428wC2_LYSM12]MCQ9211382.1 AzlD domain-containing protein [Streptococcus sp. B01]MCQ9214694.1 AzlD domain-containing protein [Streptococcus sp. O1]TFV04875.1 AzlD domain-containing protein [Streptococcus sp. LYSM12]
MINRYILVAILMALVVTWVPRVLPFVLIKGKTLSPVALKFLRFLPISIIFSLTLSSIIDEKVGSIPSILPVETMALVVTFLVILKTKNILLAVGVGVAVTAGLRFLAVF